MLRKGLATKQDLFILIASLALRRVSFYFIPLYLIITTHYTYKKLSELGTKKLVYQTIPGQDWLKY